MPGADPKAPTLSTWKEAPTRPRIAPTTNEAPELWPVLTVLGHSSPHQVGDRADLEELREVGSRAPLSRVEPLFRSPDRDGEAPLGDPYLSRRPFWLLRLADGGVEIQCHEAGMDLRVDGEAISDRRILSVEQVRRGVVLEVARRTVLLLHLAGKGPGPGGDTLGLVGESQSMRTLRAAIRGVADTDIPVLLRGETGTGKELVAHAIHRLSKRRDGPFIGINMGTIPPSLAASELFGHERGAFSGATQARRGYFVQADRGSIFLDEIGDTPSELQLALLRTVETGMVQPIGAERLHRVDARLIAATDSDLEAAVEADSFRASLLHRLAGFVIEVPPLRARRDDLGRLLMHFLREELEALGEGHRLEKAKDDRQPWLPASLVARLALYPWPGNVRELRNAARQIAVSSRGLDQACPGRWLERTLESWRPAPARGQDKGGRSRRPNEVSEDELVEALRANQWRVAPAAAQLGLAKASIYDLIAKSTRIRKAKDLSPDEIQEGLDACGGDMDRLSERLEVSRPGLLLRMRELGLG